MDIEPSSAPNVARRETGATPGTPASRGVGGIDPQEVPTGWGPPAGSSAGFFRQGVPSSGSSQRSTP